MRFIMGWLGIVLLYDAFDGHGEFTQRQGVEIGLAVLCGLACLILVLFDKGRP